MANLLRDNASCLPGLENAQGTVQIYTEYDQQGLRTDWMQLNFDSDAFINRHGTSGQRGTYGVCLDSKRRNGAICGGMTHTGSTDTEGNYLAPEPWGVWVPWTLKENGVDKADERDWKATKEVPDPDRPGETKQVYITEAVELKNPWEFTGDQDGAFVWQNPPRAWTPAPDAEPITWEIRRRNIEKPVIKDKEDNPIASPYCKQSVVKVDDPDSSWLNPLPKIQEKQSELYVYQNSSWSIRKKIPEWAETYEQDYHYVPSTSDITVYGIAKNGVRGAENFIEDVREPTQINTRLTINRYLDSGATAIAAASAALVAAVAIII